MFASVRRGLLAARDLDSRIDVLLHPADHPAVESATVRALFEESLRRPGRAILPEYEGRGGHPVLIPASLHSKILADSGDDGLRGFWKRHAEARHRLPVRDAAVAMDVDTPEQYAALGALITRP